MRKLKISVIFLIILVLALLLFLPGCQNGNKEDGIKAINAQELYEWIGSGIPDGVILLDVRTRQEYDQEGYISGSMLIPVDEIEDRLDEIPKDKTIIVYCAAGVRSRNAANILAENDFKEIHDLTGGIASWVEEGYPIEIGLSLDQGDPSPENAEGSFQGIVFINAETLDNFIKSDMDLMIIDVRSKESYDSGHIPGAVNIGLSDFKKSLDRIQKGKAIITYCSGSSCQLGKQAAIILVENGYEEVYVLPGGITEWTERGFDLE